MAVYVYDLSAAELAQIEGGGWNIGSGGDRPAETVTLNFAW
jgi:lactobin A/cerein 7B family class IIb bacteriocin